jgi:peroxiredoxin
VLDQVSAFPTSEIGIAQIPSDRPAAGILQAGDQAYDFTLQDLDGNSVNLVDFRGRPVIVNFWATWCAPCRIEMPELQAAFDHYQDEDLVILALDQDEPIDVARAYFYDEMNLTFTPLLDENSAIATSYGSYSVLPTSYFINGEGLVTAVHRGPMTMSQIEGYMADTIGDSQS